MWFPMGMAALTVAVIMWCSVSIYRRFKNAKVTFSKKTEAMNRQSNSMFVLRTARRTSSRRTAAKRRNSYFQKCNLVHPSPFFLRYDSKRTKVR